MSWRRLGRSKDYLERKAMLILVVLVKLDE
ncbi:hypothetical protein MY10362_007119 [Beauveria mimosiformis]